MMPPVSIEGMFCPDCDGVGGACSFCQGTGRVLRAEEVLIAQCIEEKRQMLRDFHAVYMRTGTWCSLATAKLKPAERRVQEEQEMGRNQVRDEIAAVLQKYASVMGEEGWEV